MHCSSPCMCNYYFMIIPNTKENTFNTAQNQHNPISSLPCWKYCKFLLKVSSIGCNNTLPLSWSHIQLWPFSLLRCFTFNSHRIWHTLNSTTTNPFHKVLQDWAKHAHLSNSVSNFSNISNCWVPISLSNFVQHGGIQTLYSLQ